MEQPYLQSVEKLHSNLDQQIVQALQHQQCEYVTVKLEDILKYQCQQNEVHKKAILVGPKLNELVEFSQELDKRFRTSVQKLELLVDNHDNDMKKFKHDLELDTSLQLQAMDKKKLLIDQNFKTSLKNINNPQ